MHLVSTSYPERFFGKPFSAEQLFCDLSSETDKSLKKITHRSLYKEKELIYDVGENPCCIYVLTEGSARLFLNSKSHEKSVIRDIKVNEILGLTETLAELPYEIGVETIQPCVCDRINRRDLLELLQNDAGVCFRLLSLLSWNLQESYKLFSKSRIP